MPLKVKAFSNFLKAHVNFVSGKGGQNNLERLNPEPRDNASQMGQEPYNSARRCPESSHLIPIGVLFHGFGVCRAFGHPHDQSDHGTVKKRVFRVLEHPGKGFYQIGFPGDRFEKLDHIGVGFRAAFFGFSGH